MKKIDEDDNPLMFTDEYFKRHTTEEMRFTVFDVSPEGLRNNVKDIWKMDVNGKVIKEKTI